MLYIFMQWFQFHYGTIKSWNNEIELTPEVIFQFHYGTIKSSISFSISALHSYFNSTMVRLKVLRHAAT